MRIYDLKDDQGDVFAFQVGIPILRPWIIIRAIKSIPSVEIVKTHISFSFEEVCWVFNVNGVQFEVFEPFGDNSMYWVGPSHGLISPDNIKLVREAFRKTWL